MSVFTMTRMKANQDQGC